ncbi:LuxR C-terminal-related transcriptional regulator [Sphaerisporangium album]|uniref:LuxR C-terminal-related transcriptional regulator n=1 Tax=Sphaerisporangium album TaxID=509200 RepID=UPI0011C0455A|nr:response regulator transcription factor [Sphaerisporangium album]
MDDEDISRRGMSTVLQEVHDISVIAESRFTGQSLPNVIAQGPDVVLIGLRAKVGLGLAAGIARDCPHTRVLILVGDHSYQFVYEAISAGVTGMLVRGADAGELVYAVRKVAAGLTVIDPVIATILFDRLRMLGQAVGSSQVAALENLSPRERDVLLRLAIGENNQEIARSMHVSVATVKCHVSNIFVKLDVRDRLGAALVARLAGVSTAGDGSNPGPEWRDDLRVAGP